MNTLAKVLWVAALLLGIVGCFWLSHDPENGFAWIPVWGAILTAHISGYIEGLWPERRDLD